jgi:hypothetical protein
VTSEEHVLGKEGRIRTISFIIFNFVHPEDFFWPPEASEKSRGGRGPWCVGGKEVGPGGKSKGFEKLDHKNAIKQTWPLSMILNNFKKYFKKFSFSNMRKCRKFNSLPPPSSRPT